MKIPAGESLTLDKDLSLTEVLEVEGVLILDPKANITLTTTKNIIVTGNLISQPDPAVNHTIRFTGIDENKFVGGGDQVLDSDVGMWVPGAGQLNMNGVQQSQIDISYDPAKDILQDKIITPAARATSNLRIEGTPTGYAHMFIKSSRPQTIRGVQFRYMGPRKDTTGDGVKELVTGRYACHFHHSDEGSRGSIIEGCIARDCNSHCFVPHGSHGVTMRNNIVYNVLEAPFWYDYGHKTNDLVWENNLVVNVGYVERSYNQDVDAHTFGSGAFVLGFGDGNTCRGNVVIGTSGDPRAAGAYIWPELRDDTDKAKDITSTWIFDDNTAINCPSGIMVWQNSEHHHIINNFTAINCDIPIFHGAYANHYQYKGGKIKGGYIDVRAASDNTIRLRFEGMEIDAADGDYCVILNECPGDGAVPVLFRACKFTGWKKAAVIDQNPGPGLKSVDLVDCNLNPSQVKVTATKSGETIRIQNQGSAWAVTKGGSKPIGWFAPSLWGNGTGLKAEYFPPDFSKVLLTRIEPNVNIFDLTHPQIHYAVPASYAVRWTGKIQPQFTEAYTFYVYAGGGVRLSVNGKSLIDKWGERYPGDVKSSTINLVAGQPYDIKLEYFNMDDRSKCTLEWSSPSLKREFVPMSQLYPADVTPPVNQPPVADAGTDQNISMSFTLSGKGSDSDAVIITYEWSQVSGPGCYITDATKASTTVQYSGAGEYVFRLTVTDDKGAKGSDEVRVTVK